MSRLSLLTLFSTTLSPDASLPKAGTIDIEAEPDAAVRTATSEVITDSDKVVAFGWRTIDGNIRFHLSLLVMGAILVASMLSTKFKKGYYYLGSVAQTRIGSGIGTVSATTPGAYTNQVGFVAAVQHALLLANFIGLFRFGTRSNVMNFTAPTATNLYILTVGDRNYDIPLGWIVEENDVVSALTTPDGRFLNAKVGGTEIYETKLDDVADGTATPKVILTAPAPILGISKPVNNGVVAFQVTTATGIVDVSYDDGEYKIETIHEADTNGLSLSGASAADSFSITTRNERGGVDVTYLVPADEMPEVLVKPWIAATPSTVTGSSRTFGDDKNAPESRA